MTLGAILLTAKFYNDVFYSNYNLAKLGGLCLAKLNAIEAFFLRTIKYEVFVSSEEFQRFEMGL